MAFPFPTMISTFKTATKGIKSYIGCGFLLLFKYSLFDLICFPIPLTNILKRYRLRRECLVDILIVVFLSMYALDDSSTRSLSVVWASPHFIFQPVSSSLFVKCYFSVHTYEKPSYLYVWLTNRFEEFAHRVSKYFSLSLFSCFLPYISLKNNFARFQDFW